MEIRLLLAKLISKALPKPPHIDQTPAIIAIPKPPINGRIKGLYSLILHTETQAIPTETVLRKRYVQ